MAARNPNAQMIGAWVPLERAARRVYPASSISLDAAYKRLRRLTLAGHLEVKRIGARLYIHERALSAFLRGEP